MEGRNMFRMSFDQKMAEILRGPLYLCPCVRKHQACIRSLHSCVCMLYSCVRIRVHQFIRMHGPTCVRMQGPYTHIRGLVCACWHSKT